MGKYQEHLIKVIELLTIKSDILLYSCGKLCLYNKQTMRNPPKVIFVMKYAEMIIGKCVPILLHAG